ncbi:MAG: HDIG domain-containing metalloprotein [Candidatus Hodarchaeota archaeon]
MKILHEWGLRKNIIDHSIIVKDIAIQMIKKIRNSNENVEIDDELVEAGALLHDIGRIKSHGIEHGYYGGELLKDTNIDERIARCAMVHVLGGFTLEDIRAEFSNDLKEKIEIPLIPETLEEKIVCLADKHVIGTRKVSLEKRFTRWFKKYGRTPFLIKARYRVLQIEKDIKEFLNDTHS